MALPSYHPYKKFPPVVDYEEVLWTPQQITTALWLDGGDSSTITADAGAVSQWADKSGNSRHFTQATAGLKPTVISGGGLNFNGDELQFAGVMPKDEISWFIVYKLNSLPATDDFNCLFCFRNDASNRTELLAMNISGYKNLTFVNDKAGDSNAGVGVTTTLSTSVQSFNWSYNNGANNSAASYSAHINGNASVVAASGAIIVYDAAVSKIGNRIAQTFPAIMDCYEIIGVVGAYSADVTQKVQGYAARKWDKLLGVTTLVDALPVSHPYKSKPPVIEKPLNYFTAMNLESDGSEYGINSLSIPR